jgi:hypothetical protein
VRAAVTVLARKLSQTIFGRVLASSRPVTTLAKIELSMGDRCKIIVGPGTMIAAPIAVK